MLTRLKNKLDDKIITQSFNEMMKEFKEMKPLKQMKKSKANYDDLFAVRYIELLLKIDIAEKKFNKFKKKIKNIS